LHSSSDESQNKAQFNLQSLGENKTGYRAENIKLFPQVKTSRKDHICLHCILYAPENVLPCKETLIRYQLVKYYHFHVMLLLVVSIMVPSEVC